MGAGQLMFASKTTRGSVDTACDTHANTQTINCAS
jgi:hypothetical protein